MTTMHLSSVLQMQNSRKRLFALFVPMDTQSESVVHFLHLVSLLSSHCYTSWMAHVLRAHLTPSLERFCCTVIVQFQSW